MSPLYRELCKRRRPLRWWRPWPSVPGDVTAAEGLAYSAAKLLLCLFLQWQRTLSICVSIPLVSSLSSSGRTVGIVMYSGDVLSDMSTDSNVLKGELFGRGLRGHFPCSVQMRVSTADACTWDSTGGNRFCGPLVSGSNLSGVCSVRGYRNSVFCVLGATVDTQHASVFQCFWMIFTHFSS